MNWNWKKILFYGTPIIIALFLASWISGESMIETIAVSLGGIGMMLWFCIFIPALLGSDPEKIFEPFFQKDPITEEDLKTNDKDNQVPQNEDITEEYS